MTYSDHDHLPRESRGKDVFNGTTCPIMELLHRCKILTDRRQSAETSSRVSTLTEAVYHTTSRRLLFFSAKKIPQSAVFQAVLTSCAEVNMGCLQPRSREYARFHNMHGFKEGTRATSNNAHSPPVCSQHLLGMLRIHTSNLFQIRRSLDRHIAVMNEFNPSPTRVWTQVSLNALRSPQGTNIKPRPLRLPTGTKLCPLGSYTL